MQLDMQGNALAAAQPGGLVISAKMTLTSVLLSLATPTQIV